MRRTLIGTLLSLFIWTGLDTASLSAATSEALSAFKLNLVVQIHDRCFVQCRQPASRDRCRLSALKHD